MFMGTIDEENLTEVELSTPIQTPADIAVEYGTNLVLTDPASAEALLAELLYWKAQGRLA